MGAAAAAAAGLAAAQGPSGGYGYGSDMGYGKLLLLLNQRLDRYSLFLTRISDSLTPFVCASARSAGGP